jgi:hypothetical protein
MHHEPPAVTMELEWDLDGFVDYLATWSAVVRYRKEQGGDPIPEFRAGLLPLWGEPALPRRVVWPLAGRIGRV